MLYNFNGNYINVTDIVAIKSYENTADNKAQYPYGLGVYLRNKDIYFGVVYTTKRERDGETRSISTAIERHYSLYLPQPVTHTELKYAIQNETDKIRRYLKKLEKMIADGMEKDADNENGA